MNKCRDDFKSKSVSVPETSYLSKVLGYRFVERQNQGSERVVVSVPQTTVSDANCRYCWRLSGTCDEEHP